MSELRLATQLYRLIRVDFTSAIEPFQYALDGRDAIEQLSGNAPGTFCLLAKSYSFTQLDSTVCRRWLCRIDRSLLEPYKSALPVLPRGQLGRGLIWYQPFQPVASLRYSPAARSWLKLRLSLASNPSLILYQWFVCRPSALNHMLQWKKSIPYL